MNKRLLVVICVIIFSCLLFSGCSLIDKPGSNSQNSSQAVYEELDQYKKLLPLAEASIDQTSADKAQNIVQAEVQIPDLSLYLPKAMEIAEAKATDHKSFQKILFQTVRELAEAGDAYITTNVEIDLIMLDPEKTDWTTEELEQLAAMYVLRTELEQFALDILKEATPPAEVNEQ